MIAPKNTIIKKVFGAIMKEKYISEYARSKIYKILKNMVQK
jgi:hypothetical protein